MVLESAYSPLTYLQKYINHYYQVQTCKLILEISMLVSHLNVQVYTM